MLQTDTVFLNVSKGVVAKEKDLKKAFGKEKSRSLEEVCKEILAKGELQVSKHKETTRLLHSLSLVLFRSMTLKDQRDAERSQQMTGKKIRKSGKAFGSWTSDLTDSELCVCYCAGERQGEGAAAGLAAAGRRIHHRGKVRRQKHQEAISTCFGRTGFEGPPNSIHPR